MVQLILIGVIVLSLGGAFWSYSSGQRQIGEERAIAEYERQQKEAEKANTMKALEGEAYALDLLRKAEQRNRAQAAAIVAARQQREVIYVEREKVDPELKAWGDTPVPLFAAVRLRDHAKSIAATASDSRVPGVAGVAPVAPIADPTGPVDESWLDRLRRKLTGSTPSGVDGSGPAGK